jgi:hypothetical protein
MRDVSFHHFYFIYIASMIDDKMRWMSNCHYNDYKSFDIDTPPNSLIDLTVSPKVKTTKGQRIRVLSLARNTLGVKGHAGVLGWGLK